MKKFIFFILFCVLISSISVFADDEVHSVGLTIVSTDLPVIVINFPSTDYDIIATNITIDYTVSDFSHDISNCSLYLHNDFNDDTDVYTNFTIVEYVSSYFYVDNLIIDVDYDFYIECWDNDAPPVNGVSDTILFSVKEFIYTPYNATYQRSDFKNIVIDGMGIAGIAFLGWIDLLIILFIIVGISGVIFGVDKRLRVNEA